MADELYAVLTRFHREIVVPDVERIVDERSAPLQREMLDGFDHDYVQLDAWKPEVRAPGTEKARVLEIEHRIAQLEAGL